MLESFSSPAHVLIIGASGGLGAGFCELLEAAPNVHLVRVARRQNDPKVAHICDICDESSVADLADALKNQPPFQLIINATGVLHDRALEITPEKSLNQINAASMARVLQVNSIGPALICKYLLPLMATSGKAVMAHLSARVGSISDNQLGGWYSYRAAKAAQNMIVKTAALEVARRHPNKLVLGLHPGTVDTGLSAPFQSAVAQQKLFTPLQSAGYLLNVIDQAQASDSGHVLAFDGQIIPA